MSTSENRSTLSLLAQILDRKDRFRLGISVLVILFGTVLEMASLSLVIPVVQAVVSGDRRSEYGWLPMWLQDISYISFVRLLMSLLILMFLVKNTFLLFSTYLQQRIQVSINNRIVQRLFVAYLRQPYEFHLMNSSSVLLRNIQDFSSAVTSSGISPFLWIATDVATGIGLLGILLLVEPVSTALMVGVFGTSSLMIIRLSQVRIKRWGSEKIEHRGLQMAALLGGLGGVKEITLFGRDTEVIETHRHNLHLVGRTVYMFQIVQNIPRVLFEVVAVSGVALLVVVSTLGHGNLQDTTLVIALFGVVAFRMLPSVNRIIQSIQQLSFGRIAIEGAVAGLSLPQREISARRTRPTDKFESLEISNLKYSYPNTESLVTDVSSLRIAAGESVGIIGASGSGKSTLVDLLIGILAPKAGSIMVNGRDITTDPRYWQDRIGYVPQHVYLMDTTIRRNVAFGLNEKEINDADVEKALRSANLWGFVQSLPARLDTVVGERGVRLSGGQRQRLGIARALYGNPEVIVLDEATSALDADTEREIVESFREIAHDHTLIVVAHRTSTLMYCNRLIRLEAGRIVQEGTFTEVIGSLPDTESRGQ